MAGRYSVMTASYWNGYSGARLETTSSSTRNYSTEVVLGDMWKCPGITGKFTRGPRVCQRPALLGLQVTGVECLAGILVTGLIRYGILRYGYRTVLGILVLTGGKSVSI